MAPAARARSEEEIKQADDLRQQGNAAFREKKYTQALGLYTASAALNPASRELFSNRSATYLALNQHSLALHDAGLALALDPAWAKAWRRKAAVLEAQHKYLEAIAAYESALDALRGASAGANEKTRKKEAAEIAKLIKAVQAKRDGPQVRTQAEIARDAPGPKLVAEMRRRMENGETVGEVGSWPATGSALRRFLIAELDFQEAKQHLRQIRTMGDPLRSDGRPGPGTMVYGRLGTLASLTSAMLEDIRVARFSGGEFEQLRLCVMFEQAQLHGIGPNVAPAAAVAEYKQRLTRPMPAPQMHGNVGPGRTKATVTGWDHVRPALNVSIRSRVLMAFLTSSGAVEGPRDAVAQFREAAEFIELVRAEWPDVPDDERGMTMARTFLRLVKAAQGDAMITHYVQRLDTAPTVPDETKTAFLAECVELGEWLVADVEAAPTPLQRAETGERDYWRSYYPYYAAMRSAGHVLIAFGHLHLAHLRPHAIAGAAGAPTTLDAAALATAALHYARAAAWLPPDDPARESWLWYAVQCMVQRGAAWLADLRVLVAMARTVTTFSRPWFAGAQFDVPEVHSGKMAWRAVETDHEGKPGAAVIGPYLRWDAAACERDGVVPSQELTDEVSLPYLARLKKEQGYLVVTEAIRAVWKERAEVWGEREEAIGAAEIWEKVDKATRKEWEMILENLEEVAEDEGAIWANGWKPPKSES